MKSYLNRLTSISVIIAFLIPTMFISKICSAQRNLVLKKPETVIKYSIDDSTYGISDSVTINNGKDEEVRVFFMASVSKTFWDNLIKEKGGTESSYFSLIANFLSIKAQYALKNPLSFEPFRKQFFMTSNNEFICDYKMMGRNGFGNLGETSAIIRYDPHGID